MVSNFWKRAISGLLFVFILTGCIFIHPICFYILFFIINILGIIEFGRMAKKMNIHINFPFCILCGSVLFTAGFLHNYIDYKDGYLFFFLLTFLMAIRELYRKQGNGFQNIAFSYYALLYISLPFTLLIYLPYMTSGQWMPEIIFFPFLLVWINDTFAYLFGSQFGKHKLFPRISPKKSWEGAIGGGVTTILAALCIAPHIEGYTIIDTAIIACIVVVFGIYGDLLESLFKRSIEIKDSGNILPGHGGILDRFDAIIFAIPAIFVYMEFMY
ncbi:phosphatidate cytidylyltransferase [Sanguibacteroides justesenii]|uniref:Phosphatidate cytidylyltransferase n=1 Tax=Sanguibacteroides justesenii TaxID=1547597 RepID=A0A0C3MCK7_9PORP|nr:phosphatidate cytidylyltransferase [Sanguibacteroides justesenii]KIO47179.1 phosphatidate cytidylyltransferase [Sanguibacteroides justesenii]